ncbi:uncharacterized protein LOC129947896 [Eupeodes corollae]|uniref:uncharacterized protein LOC129947896 n=1 Tax=Eupeodes corollae TaxID=290404 RepID=UPI002492D20F|nr:uncharacterized protein LOC129947896 [Eupeodes corollae]
MNDAKLIDLVEAQPSIYDKTDIFYSNKEHVRSIWQMIAGEMQLEVPVCQKRWRYLRDYFVRQLHITDDNNCNGVKNEDDDGEDGEKQVVAAAFSGKRSYWPFYDRLSFLKPFSSTRRRIKRTSSDEVTSQRQLSHDDIIYSTQSICSESSDRSRMSSNSTASIGGQNQHPAEDAFSNIEYLKFYQAMQMAAQQNFNSNNNGYGHQFPVAIAMEDEDEMRRSPAKKKRHQNQNGNHSSGFPLVEYDIDEHDCFFKSILSSVRKISDEHIIAFRTEVLQVLMKFRNLSDTATDNEASDVNEEFNGEDDGEEDDDDVVVVNTEEAHWRKNLFRKKL